MKFTLEHIRHAMYAAAKGMSSTLYVLVAIAILQNYGLRIAPHSIVLFLTLAYFGNSWYATREGDKVKKEHNTHGN